MGQYTIKDLEKLSRVKAHTIRIWEKRYGLLSPSRSSTNIRAYNDDDLRRLLNIALLNNSGLKISRIARLSEAEVKAKILELDTTGGTPADVVENLIVATTEFDADRFEKVVAGCVLRMGFEQCMFDVLIPFMHRVGILWQVGAMKPGQEHFVSNLIRQKVIAAIDATVPPARTDGKAVVMFLPEGELHEIGLLFGHYLLRKLGHEVIYLGQTLPMEDLVAIVQRRQPDVLVTAILTMSGHGEVEEYLKELVTRFPTTRILVHTHHGEPGQPPVGHLRLMTDLRELVAAMA